MVEVFGAAVGGQGVFAEPTEIPVLAPLPPNPPQAPWELAVFGAELGGHGVFELVVVVVEEAPPVLAPQPPKVTVPLL